MEEETGLQGMRGLSSIMVMYYHLVTYSMLPVGYLLILLTGYSGVYFFFLISGYIITRKILSEDYKSNGKVRFLKYYLRRIFRIWPLYFISLPLFAITKGMPIVWQNFLFLQNYSLLTFYNSPLWTLLVEQLFYLIIPLWTFAFIKNWKASSVFAFGLTLGYILFIGQYHLSVFSMNYIYYFEQFPMFAMTYALGTLAALGKTLKIRNSGIAILMLWLFASFFLVIEQEFVTVLMFSILYFLILCNFKDSKIFTNKVSHFLGKISYSTYIISVPVDLAVMKTVGTASYMYIPLAIALTMASAYLLYRLVERPFIGLGRRIENLLV